MTATIDAARALYARTLEEQFALGAFNMDNQETLIAIARAAAHKSVTFLS
jgi:fructose/tagatose bisphosphate aldolase